MFGTMGEVNSVNWVRWHVAVLLASPVAGFAFIGMLFTNPLFGVGLVASAVAGGLFATPANQFGLRAGAFVAIVLLGYPVGGLMFTAACEGNCLA